MLGTLQHHFRKICPSGGCATASDANPGFWPPPCPKPDFAFALHDLLALWNEHERPQAANWLNPIQERLHEGDGDGFAGELEVFFSGLAYRNLASEACFRAALQTLFRLAGDHVQAEKSTWRGRSDLEETFGDHTYVMEIKRGRSAAEALRPIRDRPYGREHLQPHHTVTAVGLAFRKDDARGTHLECEYADLSELLSERNTDMQRRSPARL